MSAALAEPARPPDLQPVAPAVSRAKLPDSFVEVFSELIPALRSFALRLTSSRHEADDLVQETLARAWRYRCSYQAGTNMKSWLNKIMQNAFYNDIHRRRGTVQDVDGKWAALQMTPPSQEWTVRYHEMLNALETLSPDLREALLLIFDGGYSYDEAAQIAACPVGTMKSRVNRARERLAQLIDAPDTGSALALAG